MSIFIVFQVAYSIFPTCFPFFCKSFSLFFASHSQYENFYIVNFIPQNATNMSCF